MSLTVDMVRVWLTGAFWTDSGRVGQGRDLFVPSQNQYPHIQIGKDFIVWSKSPWNHTDLMRGGMAYPANISDALISSTSAFRGNELLRYLISQC